jgi:diguanylate cyclase
VTDLPGGERDRAIVRTVTALGHDMGLVVVAEGVETAAQLEALRRVRCDEYQGFLFGRPLAEEALLALRREPGR